MNANYDNLMQEILKSEKGKKILMHACCAPCATSVCERVKEDADLALFWYNPNIQNKEEHDKRLENLRILTKEFNLPLFQCPTDKAQFEEAVKGYETEREGGARCPLCFYLRLYVTAVIAKEQGFDYFCTTLTVSPHKNASVINSIGEEIAGKVGVKWLYSDFKKRNGYLRSIELSKEMGLYRQNYCGCDYGRQAED